MTLDTPTRRRGRRAKHAAAETSARAVDYRNLRNPFPTMNVFSDDRIEAMHEAALDVLERLGIKVLLPEARTILARAGAHVDEDSEMVYLGRDIVEAALAIAPRSITCRAASRDRDLTLELGRMVFQPGAGAPHATDLTRGRRPGTETDFRELLKLTQAFDVLHMIPPLIEPQDVPIHLRHYATLDAQFSLTDKLPFVFSRGTPQVR